jgi:hypothetical protein
MREELLELNRRDVPEKRPLMGGCCCTRWLIAERYFVIILRLIASRTSTINVKWPSRINGMWPHGT